MISDVLKRGPPSTPTASRAPVPVRALACLGVCVLACACVPVRSLVRLCVASSSSCVWVRSLTPILASLWVRVWALAFFALTCACLCCAH